MVEDTKENKVKRRKIRQKDWQKVEEFLKKELARRKDCRFRKAHETIWKEVDRQIAMQPMQKLGPDGKPMAPTWQSAFELGELSKGSEVLTADTMRLMFPQNRTWLEVHVKPPMTVDPQTGRAVVAADPNKQKLADGALRSMMAQQHEDFGLKARVELSVKEALHHGGFVATAEWDEQNKVYDGQGLESLAAPVWKPHSMWNCYPDPSPSVIPANIFYSGSMMIVSYMPRYKVLQLKGDGYMNIDPKKIPKKKNSNKDVETEDVEIVTYYGDLCIEREDGDIYLPNSRCMTANGVIIFYKANPLPFPEVIYQGYERQDIRDPYFTSPIVKNSPLHKLATIMANKFVDVVDLHGLPPVVYDGNDPYMVANGGLNIWPGAQTPSKGSNKFQEVKIGDPKASLSGLELALAKLEEGMGVNAIRSGGGSSDRKTATEVRDTQMGGEIRTVDFVDKLERGGLRPFLYMQHELNLKRLKSYSFYCSEKGLPDFLTMTTKEIPKVVHFEVVGSKGVLGEERRAQQMTAVTAFASQNPLFAPLLNAPQILIDMYEDAGVKGAETYINADKQIPPEVQAKLQQAEQVIGELQKKLQEAESNMQAEFAKLQLKRQADMADAKLDKEKADRDYALAVDKMRKDFGLKLAEFQATIALERKQMQESLALERQKAAEHIAIERTKAQEKERSTAPRTKTRKIRFADGEEATITDLH